MESIETKYLYSFNEILLRQTMIAIKRDFGDFKSKSWQNIFIMAGKEPPFMEKDFLQELVDAYNTDSEKPLELSIPDKLEALFCLVICQLLTTSDDDSLITVDSENILDLLEALKPIDSSSLEDKEKYSVVRKKVFSVFGNAKIYLMLKKHIHNHPDNLKEDISELLKAYLNPICIEVVWLIYCLLSAVSTIQLESLNLLHEYLQKGMIIAYGVEFPFINKPKVTEIEPLEWEYLEFYPMTDKELVAKYKNSSELGVNRTYSGLVFTVTEEATEGNHIKNKKAGRPTIMGSIAEQMQKRFDENKLSKNLASEARELELWAIKKYTKSKAPSNDSIAKSKVVNQLYYKLNPKNV